MHIFYVTCDIGKKNKTFVSVSLAFSVKLPESREDPDFTVRDQYTSEYTGYLTQCIDPDKLST